MWGENLKFTLSNFQEYNTVLLPCSPFSIVPLTVASAEILFSKLKIIPNLLYLTRATENEIAKSINFYYLINEFAEKQARKKSYDQSRYHIKKYYYPLYNIMLPNISFIGNNIFLKESLYILAPF